MMMLSPFTSNFKQYKRIRFDDEFDLVRNSQSILALPEIAIEFRII
jgi:hypothetical protein